MGRKFLNEIAKGPAQSLPARRALEKAFVSNKDFANILERFMLAMVIGNRLDRYNEAMVGDRQEEGFFTSVADAFEF